MVAVDREPCITNILKSEGGYTNDPKDPGGPTNWGITIFDVRLHWKKDATAADVKAMPKSVAIEIYRQKYWAPLRCDDLPSGLDYSVVDFGVNSGIARSARYLQEILGVKQDGKIGDDTITAVRKHDPVELITRLNADRLLFLEGLKTWSHFGKGWGTRVAFVKAISLHMAADAAHPAIVQPAPVPAKPIIVPTPPVKPAAPPQPTPPVAVAPKPIIIPQPPAPVPGVPTGKGVNSIEEFFDHLGEELVSIRDFAAHLFHAGDYHFKSA